MKTNAEGLELTFHGAAGTVTGSCIELNCGGHRLLIDCGLFQGPRTLERLNFDPFRFQPHAIDAVILSHAHIDHSGLIPRLAGKGFAGAIWSTSATRDLAGYMLADSARLQESDTSHRNKRRDRSDEPPIEPLYDADDVALALALFRDVELETWFEPAPGFRARLWNAGHILGSCSVQIEAAGVSLLFSGDLGPAQKSLELPSAGPSGVDHVICEATYGDRERPAFTLASRRVALKEEVEAALSRGGNLVIPVFAVERTQELLLDLADLIDQGQIPGRPIFIDSPLATRVTSVFASQNVPDTRSGAVFHHPCFHFVDTAMESMRLNSLSGAIIMAGSGMCEGGRVRHHLVHNLSRSESTVLFVGYQAKGTLGRAILDGAGRVRISGRDIAVRAQIRHIDTYSAHADRADLLHWIAARQPIGGTLMLGHGEPPALQSLREGVGGHQHVVIPAIGERYRLLAGQQAKRLSTGDADMQAIVGGDWQNDYADFAVNLKRELQAIEDARTRREALRRMRRVLDDYASYRNGRKQASQKREQHRARDRAARR